MSLKQGQIDKILGAIGNIYTLYSGSPNVAVTGTTNETVLHSVTVPANVLGNGGSIIIIPLWQMTNSINTKTMRTRFGGALIEDIPATTSAGLQHLTMLYNSAINSQVSFNVSNNSGLGLSTLAPVTFNVDTSIDQVLSFSGVLTNIGESISLKGLYVGLIPWTN